MNKIYFTDKILAATILKLFPASITPNQITIFRFLTIPFLIWFLYVEKYIIAVPLFIISAFSDALDGALARTKNKITNWGKIYDPLADKLLIITTAIIIVPKYLNPILVVLIVFFEVLIVSSVYYREKFKNITIQVTFIAKMKMLFQSLGLTCLLLVGIFSLPFLITISEFFLYVSIVFAFVSFLNYSL